MKRDVLSSSRRRPPLPLSSSQSLMGKSLSVGVGRSRRPASRVRFTSPREMIKSERSYILSLSGFLLITDSMIEKIYLDVDNIASSLKEIL